MRKSRPSTAPGTPNAETEPSESAFHQTISEELKPPSDGDAGSDSSRLKQLLAVLKKTIGVSDLSSLRLSLPANLIHPEGNLEYWHYLDRPDLFAAISDSDDAFQRMLAVLRWTLTKDLKQSKGKLVKPYNSVLGEQFRAIWDVYPSTLDPESQQPQYSHGIDVQAAAAAVPLPQTEPSSSASSIRSFKSVSSSPQIGSYQPSKRSLAASSSTSLDSLAESLASSQVTAVDSTKASSTPGTSLQSAPSTSSRLPKEERRARIAFLNEQVSHHPPISTFWYESQPAEGGQRVQGYGVDQLSAKFTGTSVKVYAGSQNKGIYVKLPDRDSEEYNITHPTAFITGFLRGSPYITIADTSFVTCLAPDGKAADGTKALRTIISYPDESWIGKARFALEGIIYEYTLGTDAANYSRIKQVPESSIRGYLEGSWRGKITLKTSKTGKATTLIDVGEILPLPKMVRAIDEQHEMESRRLWQTVTEAILSKQYGQATKNKQAIEQGQRDLAAHREKTGERHEIVLFDDDYRLLNEGRPRLSQRGQEALQAEFAGTNYSMDSIPPLLQSKS